MPGRRAFMLVVVVLSRGHGPQRKSEYRSKNITTAHGVPFSRDS
jgi:hypothetical protein